MEKLWDDLKLDNIIQPLLDEHDYEFDVISALKGMVFNRATDAQSKLATYDWLQNDVYFPAGKKLELHHLYRALDFLIVSIWNSLNQRFIIT